MSVHMEKPTTGRGQSGCGTEDGGAVKQEDTLMPGAAAFSTKTVTSMKARRLSPPGKETMVSRLLGERGHQGKRRACWLEPNCPDLKTLGVYRGLEDH